MNQHGTKLNSRYNLYTYAPHSIEICWVTQKWWTEIEPPFMISSQAFLPKNAWLLAVGESEFITFSSELIRKGAQRRHGKHALHWDKAQRSVTAGRNNLHLGMSQRLAVNWPIIALPARFEENATPLNIETYIASTLLDGNNSANTFPL
jgi:hypothetical protein